VSSKLGERIRAHKRILAPLAFERTAARARLGGRCTVRPGTEVTAEGRVSSTLMLKSDWAEENAVTEAAT
jgi:hypothetical protein